VARQTPLVARFFGLQIFSRFEITPTGVRIAAASLASCARVGSMRTRILRPLPDRAWVPLTFRSVAGRPDRIAGRSYAPAGRFGPPTGRFDRPAGRSGSPAGRSSSPASRFDLPADRSGSPASSFNASAGRSNAPADRFSSLAGRSIRHAGRSGLPASRPVRPARDALLAKRDRPTIPQAVQHEQPYREEQSSRIDSNPSLRHCRLPSRFSATRKKVCLRRAPGSCGVAIARLPPHFDIALRVVGDRPQSV